MRAFASSTRQRTKAPQVAQWVLLVTLMSAANPATPQQPGVTEGPAGILAVQLRQQGHRCDEPARAEPDAARSRPDERAWVVKCANASYRMRLMPNMAALIEPLD
jgi:hypothetical protein